MESLEDSLKNIVRKTVETKNADSINGNEEITDVGEKENVERHKEVNVVKETIEYNESEMEDELTGATLKPKPFVALKKHVNENKIERES